MKQYRQGQHLWYWFTQTIIPIIVYHNISANVHSVFPQVSVLNITPCSNGTCAFLPLPLTLDVSAYVLLELFYQTDSIYWKAIDPTGLQNL